MRPAFVAVLAWAAAGAASSQPLPSRPSPPGLRVFITCRVTEEALTADCETAPTTQPRADRTLLARLAANPLRLPGAPAGTRLTISVWRDEVLAGRTTPPPWAGGFFKGEMARRSYEAFSRYYPDRALRMEVDGRGLIRCRVLDDGRLNECWIRRDEPPEFGFGAAALRASVEMWAVRPGPDAPPYAERVVDVPVNFLIPRDEAPAPQ